MTHREEKDLDPLIVSHLAFLQRLQARVNELEAVLLRIREHRLEDFWVRTVIDKVLP